MNNKINLPNIVRQPYQLTANFVKYKFSTYENRILTRVLQRIKVHQEVGYSPQIDINGNIELQFYWKDLLLANDNSKNNLEDSLKTLREKTLPIESKMMINGKWELSTKLIGVIEKPEWNRSRSHVKIRLDEQYYLFLTDLSKGYTEYIAENSFKLSGVYNIKFYYYIKHWFKSGGRKVSLEQFRNEMEIPEDKYQTNTYPAFKQRVIDPAKKALDELSDVSFNFTPIKEGRKVTGISFVFYKTNNPAPSKHSTKQIEEVFSLLEPNFKLSKEVKSRLIGMANKYQITFLKSLINTHYFDISENFDRVKDLPNAINRVILDHYEHLFQREKEK